MQDRFANIKQALRFPIDFLVYGNLLVGLGAYSIALFFLKLNRLSDMELHPYPLFVFSATVFIYNFHRRMGHELYAHENTSASIQWMLENKISSRLITLVSFACSVYFFMDLSKASYLLITPIAMISLLYIIKVSRVAPLRHIPLLKIFLIALIWSLACVYLGKIELLTKVKHSPLLLSAALFFFMIAEVLPFDIRDMQSDLQAQLKTIPLKLGSRPSLWLAFTSLLISNLLFFWALDGNSQASQYLPWLFSSLFLLLTFALVRQNRSDLFYSLLIESSLCIPYICSHFWS